MKQMVGVVGENCIEVSCLTNWTIKLNSHKNIQLHKMMAQNVWLIHRWSMPFSFRSVSAILESLRRVSTLLDLKKKWQNVINYFRLKTEGHVFWMERQFPLSKITSDQNFTCQIFENMSELILDTGFRLSIQNTWKNLPHVP